MTARIVLGVVLLADPGFACGGSDPAPSGSGGTATGPTITITSSGVNPKTAHGGARHAGDVRQQRHPTSLHGKRSASRHMTTVRRSIQLASLNAGQQRQTGNLNTVRRCGFHDHDNPTNTGLQGTIVIQ